MLKHVETTNQVFLLAEQIKQSLQCWASKLWPWQCRIWSNDHKLWDFRFPCFSNISRYQTMSPSFNMLIYHQLLHVDPQSSRFCDAYNGPSVSISGGAALQTKHCQKYLLAPRLPRVGENLGSWESLKLSFHDMEHAPKFDSFHGSRNIIRGLLLGGLEHVFVPFGWEFHHPNSQTHIFQQR